MLKIDDSQLEGSLNNYDGATEEFRQIENNIGSNNCLFFFLSLSLSKECSKSRLKIEIKRSLFEIKTKTVQPGAAFHGLQITHTFVVWCLRRTSAL